MLYKHGNHLHLFYKMTNERGTKTVFTYAHVKWFYGQSERAYHLNYFMISHDQQCSAIDSSSEVEDMSRASLGPKVFVKRRWKSR